MQIYNQYIFRTTFIATLFISVVLIAVTTLTQSLRFLELIVEAGASTWSFWALTFLNLPKFFEVILPISFATSVIFILNKMTLDSEMAVLKATGFSQWHLAKPILLLGVLFSIFLLSMTTWIGPLSINKMNILRQSLKSEFTGLLFKDGVFNEVGNGLTFYIRDLDTNGELHGLMIHDNRIKDEPAKTVYAKTGVLAETSTGHKIIVFNGARQDFNPETKSLQKLHFDRYSIDLPEEEQSSKKRWKKPKERPFKELITAKNNPDIHEKYKREFFVEAHLRVISPFLVLTYIFIAVTTLLYGSINRRGQSKKIIITIGGIILLQSLYITLSNMAIKSNIALISTYGLIMLPIGVCFYFLYSTRKG